MDAGKGIRIAISGKSGCGNTTISGLVARRLGLTLINYTFHTVAEEQGIPFKELHDLAENDSSWDRYVDERQVELAEQGNCVLGSRLAVWHLRDADLSAYLYASQEIRSGRIFKREGGSLKSVMEETVERDRRDHERYLKLYSIDNDDYRFVDLTINTESLGVEQIAKIIIEAVRIKTGFSGMQA